MITKLSGMTGYIAGAALFLTAFVAGGEVIGGYKANKAKETCSKVQKTIVANALAQATELADAWEAENKKARDLQRRLERTQGALSATEAQIDVLAEEREAAISEAAKNLSQCLLNDETRDLLNDWMTDDPADFS